MKAPPARRVAPAGLLLRYAGKFAEVLLGQPAPAGGVTAAIARRGTVRFNGARISVAGGGGITEAFHGLTVVVESFGIVRTPLGVDLQFVASVTVLARRDIDAAEFAQHFARTVALVLADHGLEMGKGVAETSLLAGDTAELEVGVGEGGVDLDRLRETGDGLGVLVALLVNQSELILRLAIVRIDGGGLEHAAEALPAAQSRAEAGEFAAQVIPGEEEEERRRQHAQQELQAVPR